MSDEALRDAVVALLEAKRAECRTSSNPDYSETEWDRWYARIQAVEAEAQPSPGPTGEETTD